MRVGRANAHAAYQICGEDLAIASGRFLNLNWKFFVTFVTWHHAIYTHTHAHTNLSAGPPSFLIPDQLQLKMHKQQFQTSMISSQDEPYCLLWGQGLQRSTGKTDMYHSY